MRDGDGDSTVVAQTVKEYGQSQGIDVVVDQAKVMETLRGIEDYGLIASTTQSPSRVDTPAVSGLPFLTG